MKKILLTTASIVCLIAANSAIAEEVTWQNEEVLTSDAEINQVVQLSIDIAQLQREWAHIKYQPETLKDYDGDSDAQEDAMEELAKKAEMVAAKYPNDPEPKVWEAIILSTEAGFNGGLGSLSLVEKSRDLLLEAEKINPYTLDGSIYTSLGSLYYKVPGWPVAFGDNDKARAYLEKARSINPNGIDQNFFYGEFLYEAGEYQKAKQILELAYNAQPRTNRELADAGRKQEIQELLVKVNKKLR